MNTTSYIGSLLSYPFSDTGVWEKSVVPFRGMNVECSSSAVRDESKRTNGDTETNDRLLVR